jgi:hypothetical protein
MFGAYWCSHCINQKEILGREVFTGTSAVLQYIECDADGASASAVLERCTRKLGRDAGRMHGWWRRTSCCCWHML